MIHPPLLLIGTHRSGTTWLGEAFSKASDVAYWSEPRQVWTYRNWFRKNDVLMEADARPAIKKYIRHRFEQYLRAQNAERFCEKTPSNCLRIRFIKEVFPEARFVLILRDGRAVVQSTQVITSQGGARWKRVSERLFESRPWEWPAYVEKSNLLWKKLFRSKNHYWGVRPPGWQEWIDLEPDIFFAKQWSETMDRALDDFESLPNDQRMMIRYEHLVSNSDDTIGKLIEFSRIQDAKAVREFILTTRDPQRTDQWRQSITATQLERWRPHMESTLKRIDYDW